MPVFHGLDKALRWLRMQHRRKQREVAQAAGITQAMLCSYEQGKRHPSLRTLEKILDTLEVDLPRLSQVLRTVRQDPARQDPTRQDPARLGAAGQAELPVLESWLPNAASTPPEGEPRAAAGAQNAPAPVDLYAALGIVEPLPAEQELALRQMMQGFLTWLRLLHNAAASNQQPGSPSSPSPSPGGD